MEAKILSLVKGLCFRSPKDIAAARLLEVGDDVVLQKEPDNPEDTFAIKVLTRPGNFIGYIDREYSELLTRHFDYTHAKVVKVRHTEIPYIYLQIHISESPIQPVSIVVNPSELSSNERMMILTDTIVASSNVHSIPDGYGRYGFKISWTEELPRENVLRAKKCKAGDPLKLLLQSPSRYPGRIHVYTIDDILIGYIDEDAHKGLSDIFDHVCNVSIYSAEALDRIMGEMNIPIALIGSLPSPQGYFDYFFKEVQSAADLAKEDPMLALDIIQYAIANEKGLYAKDIALKCFWHLKDWESRRAMAVRMLDVIDSMREDEFTPFNFRLIKTRKALELVKIIETCDKKLAARKKSH